MNYYADQLRQRHECTAGFTRDIFILEHRYLDLDAADEIEWLEKRIKELEAGDCRFHCRSRRKENG